MKTILEWYNMLPEPYKSHAIANGSHQHTLDRQARSLCSALRKGFIWDATPEGWEYWLSVAERCAFLFDVNFCDNDY